MCQESAERPLRRHPPRQVRGGEKECIWALAYDRLKAYGEEEAMLERPVVFRNGALRGTSAWANAFLGRDHHAAGGESGGASRSGPSKGR